MKQYIIFFMWFLWMAGSQAATPQNSDTTNQLFKLSVQVISNHTLEVKWDIAPGHYLLAGKLRFQSDTPGIEIQDPDLPVNETVVHSIFGELPIFREHLTLKIPFQHNNDAGQELRLKVSYQGCSDAEECYPSRSETVILDLGGFILDSATPSKQDPSTQNPELAFLFAATLKKDHILLTWNISDDCYLYRKDLHFSANYPNAVGEAILPKGILKKDEYFGEVEVYQHKLEVRIPLLDTRNVDTLTLYVTYRGCAEGSLCFPAQEKIPEFILSPTLAKTTTNNDLFSSSSGGNSLGLNNRLSDSYGEYLTPEEAFIFTASLQDKQHFTAYWKIAEGYYLYRNKITIESLNGIKLGEISLPQGMEKEDPEYGLVKVFHDSLEASVPFTNPDGVRSLSLIISYQGCAEAGLCYPPELKHITVTLPDDDQSATSVDVVVKTVKTEAVASLLSAAPPQPAALSEQDQLAQTLAHGNVFHTLMVFFGLGLLLAFTPCVFPMVPILSGIIVGRGQQLTTRQAFFISLTYVLAMALTYTVVGLIAGLLGHNLQAALQTPWVLYTFAGMFVLLALSMFGFYELQLPTVLQNKLNEFSARQQGGTYIGAAIMGFLSALIVGPCVAPPLAGALLYLSQTGGSAWLGGAALFFLSLGMGLPLILVGVSAGHFLPRAGGWMEAVKHVFGVLLLGVAVWMLERVIPAPVSLLLWGILCIVPAVYLGALDSLPPDSSGWRKLWKGIGVLLLVYGILLIIGAAQGSSDIFQPLRGTSTHNSQTTSLADNTQYGLRFKRIQNLAELEREVQQAAANGQGVMLDFYADWCISCKEMERFTFSDPTVIQALSGVVLLQADVTANNADDRALMKNFSLFGPPGIIFYDRKGQEYSSYRVVGFMKAEAFAEHVQRIYQVTNH